MSAEKRKQPAVGDRGQRYEIWCDDEDGQPMQIGWSNKPDGFARTVELHPCWSNHRTVDRLGAAAVKSESASDADGARSCPAPGSGIPLPKCLEGIYSSCGPWRGYDPAEGYEKRPCMVRLKHGGRVMGPCWPNAGKFTLMDGNLQWPEVVVEAVAYFVSAEDSPNEKLSV